MLFSNQVNASSVLAAQLQSRGFAVVAEPGTPLHKLTSTYVIAQSDVMPQGEKFVADLKFILKSSNAMDAHLDGLDVPQTDALENLAKDIAPYVRNHMFFTKTVAVPLMNAMAAAYSEAANKYTFAPTGHDVVVYNAPAPTQDASFKELIQQFARAPMGNAPGYIDLGIGSASVKDLCANAIPGMEDCVSQWLAALGDAKIEMFYSGVFSATPANPVSLEPLIMGEDGFDASCFLFLASMALHDNPPENTKMSLVTYNNLIQALRVRVASRLNYLIQEFDAFIETKTLIIGYNRARVRVVGEVYKEFLTEGGSAGLLTAIVRMKNPCRTLHEIADQKDAIEMEQRKQNLMLNATADNQKYAVLRDLLVFTANAEVGKAFNKIYPDCKSQGVDPNWGNFISFKKKLDDMIKTVRLEQLSDVWVVCAQVVANCVFPHMACVGKMIYGMESVKRANPKITVEEASLLACCEYVFDFVIDQMAVIKDSK